MTMTMNRRSPNYCMCTEVAPDGVASSTAVSIWVEHSPWPQLHSRSQSQSQPQLQLQFDGMEHLTATPRLSACPRGLLICCGSCVHVCPARCAWDVQSRLHMAYSTSTHRRLFENIPKILNHYQATNLVNQITSAHYNKIRSLDTTSPWPENPNKYDYAPQVEMELVGHAWRPKVDELTGVVSILHWPKSGLCPWCLPRVSPYGRPGRPRTKTTGGVK